MREAAAPIVAAGEQADAAAGDRNLGGEGQQQVADVIKTLGVGA